ncbi:unnamed protein product (macronuclear) [Paramecium tetraurelia]|uniref:THH1/TOM1/TOM3 domain-containing protein n=1 Tax=Paramecium tetraurelia TaxID=5888 RepID=A0BGI5_PARTE|nr:uncharacterized protein GSPATT00028687001 [Paramecium tetraurelia]CAK57652.1 unnamed protein product [Paramecium tetraurelia]|eukprot:XP_001425050.1 hypothetical protein (macronuclear) [Paramecium tetraurelia strain d4-2]
MSAIKLCNIFPFLSYNPFVVQEFINSFQSSSSSQQIFFLSHIINFVILIICMTQTNNYSIRHADIYKQFNSIVLLIKQLMSQCPDQGFKYCVSGKCENLKLCVDLYLGTAFSLLLMILCTYQITVRVIEQRRIYKRKQVLFLIILAANIFFLIFTINRHHIFAYFLCYYFDLCFLIFLVYFFTKKATDLNVYNKSKSKLVRGCTYGLFSLFTILLFINIIVYYLFQKNCSYLTLFVIKVVELLSSIIFITGAYFLNQKMNALIIEQIMFTNRMTGVEKTQYIKTRNIKLKFWTLVCVTAFGQIIQWGSDLIYFLYDGSNDSNKCEFLINNNLLNPLVDLFICLFGYFLPLFCAVYLFWYKKKKVQYVESLEVESLPERYYHKLLNKSNSSFSSTQQK